VVLHQLDQEVARPEQQGVAAGVGQSAERVVLGPVESDVGCAREAERVDPEALGLREIRHRRRHAARDDGNFGSRTRRGCRAARIVLHQLEQDALGVAHADPPRSGRTTDGGDGAHSRGIEPSESRVQIVHVQTDRRVPDVAGTPVIGQRTHGRTLELEHLELHELPLVDQPPADRSGVGEPLHERGAGSAKRLGAPGRQEAEHVAVERERAREVRDAERDLGQMGRALHRPILPGAPHLRRHRPGERGVC
jgi:hypothetical protein